MPVFIKQMKKYYMQQCYFNQQFFRIVGSMGIFGNLTESVGFVSNAFREFLYRPSLMSGGNLVKQTIKQSFGTV
jgi:hypothetical protein